MTVPLEKDTKIFYKYVVDGEWLINEHEALGHDEGGNVNNVLNTADLVEAKSTGSKIPEAGGLVAATTGIGAAVAGAASAVGGAFSTTVLPSSEGKQATLGEPGIHVPTDPDALEAFTKFENVDPKTLNEEAEEEEKGVAATGIASESAAAELTPEEKKKQKKKLKKTQYRARKKKRAVEEAAVTGAPVPSDTTSPETSPEAEEPVVDAKADEPAHTLDPTVIGAVGGAGAVGVAASSVEPTSVPTEGIKAEKEVVPEPVEPSGAETVPVAASAADTGIAPPVESALAEPEPKPDVAPVAEEPVAISSEPVTSEPAATGTSAAAPAAVSVPAIDGDEEIIVAKGGHTAEELEKELGGANGKISLEEIKPSQSEAKKLTEEAELHEAKDKKTTAAPAKATAASSKAKKDTTKKDKKEKKGFFSKLKKILL